MKDSAKSSLKLDSKWRWMIQFLFCSFVNIVLTQRNKSLECKQSNSLIAGFYLLLWVLKTLKRSAEENIE